MEKNIEVWDLDTPMVVTSMTLYWVPGLGWISRLDTYLMYMVTGDIYALNIRLWDQRITKKKKNLWQVITFIWIHQSHYTN